MVADDINPYTKKYIEPWRIILLGYICDQDLFREDVWQVESEIYAENHSFCFVCTNQTTGLVSRSRIIDFVILRKQEDKMLFFKEIAMHIIAHHKRQFEQKYPPESVLILAAGHQDRFGVDQPLKQLLPAGPETILARIVRQVRARGLFPTIVTHRQKLMLAHASCIAPYYRRWKVESLLDIETVWGSKSTLVLLGDVIYQGQVIDRIFNDAAPDMFYGNYAEIFAYRFSRKSLARIMLTKTLQRCQEQGDKGSLHSLFRSYIDDHLSESIERQKDQSPWFTHVTGDGGWTRDIDVPADYERFVKEVIETNKLDDKEGI